MHATEDPSKEPKVENEMLSVKMRLAKAICWKQVKFGDDAEKPISDDAKKTFAEATQLLENVLEQSGKSSPTCETLKMRKKVHHIKEGREVLEKLPELSKENGKDEDLWRQHSSELPNDELLWRPRMRRLPRGASQT